MLVLKLLLLLHLRSVHRLASRIYESHAASPCRSARARMHLHLKPSREWTVACSSCRHLLLEENTRLRRHCHVTGRSGALCGADSAGTIDASRRARHHARTTLGASRARQRTTIGPLRHVKDLAVRPNHLNRWLAVESSWLSCRATASARRDHERGLRAAGLARHCHHLVRQASGRAALSARLLNEARLL